MVGCGGAPPTPPTALVPIARAPPRRRTSPNAPRGARGRRGRAGCRAGAGGATRCPYTQWGRVSRGARRRGPWNRGTRCSPACCSVTPRWTRHPSSPPHHASTQVGARTTLPYSPSSRFYTGMGTHYAPLHPLAPPAK